LIGLGRDPACDKRGILPIWRDLESEGFMKGVPTMEGYKCSAIQAGRWLRKWFKFIRWAERLDSLPRNRVLQTKGCTLSEHCVASDKPSRTAKKNVPQVISPVGLVAEYLSAEY
jgi:hypothetical protein